MLNRTYRKISAVLPRWKVPLLRNGAHRPAGGLQSAGEGSRGLITHSGHAQGGRSWGPSHLITAVTTGKGARPVFGPSSDHNLKFNLSSMI